MAIKRYDNPGLRARYTQCLNAAKRRNIEFYLTYEQFTVIVLKPCYYCGKEYDEFNGGNKDSNTHRIKCCSLDRIDNDYGYDEENCVPACKFCNNAKGILSEKEFIENCERVLLYQYSRNFK